MSSPSWNNFLRTASSSSAQVAAAAGVCEAPSPGGGCRSSGSGEGHMSGPGRSPTGEGGYGRAYTVATYVAIIGLSVGAALIFGPMVAPSIGRWLFSMGAISVGMAEQMAWGPIALFGTLVP